MTGRRESLPPASLAIEVRDWLAAMPHIIETVPVTVTIGAASYRGACYTTLGTYTGNMTAVQRGDKKAGDTYTREMILLVGTLPDRISGRANSKVAFRFPNDSRDWYLASYTNETCLDPPYGEYHPFGLTFQLAPWEVPDGTAIDHYEATPYTRVSASVAVAS